MTATPCQRWNRRRARYRPAGERIDPSRHGVELLTEAEARRFVVEQHYSGSYPAARCRVGLYRTRPGVQAGVDLVGVAVYSVPAGPAVLRRWCGVTDSRGAVELGRFVLLDVVEGDGESWFLARAHRQLAAALPEVQAVLSFSDPIPRRRLDGSLLKPGHLGIIYQAHNARFAGRSNARTLYLTPDGLVFSDRASSKLRSGDRGWRYAAEQLRASGAPSILTGESGRSYWQRILASGHLRRARHPGNLAYLWALGDRRQRRRAATGFPPAMPFPRAPSTGRQQALL